MFYKVGRSFLRPIYDQKYSRDGSIGPQLRIALLWWRRALQQDLSETHAWETEDRSPAHLFVDARGEPARCAAVLFDGFSWLYTDGAPSERVMSNFKNRSDSQIMGLEMVAISLGLSTFASRLQNRKVIVHSDNKGAEGAARKAMAKEWDHCRIAHEIWSLALRNKMHLWITRVASKDNISDSPSREEYGLMQELGATFVPPVVAQCIFEGLE